MNTTTITRRARTTIAAAAVAVIATLVTTLSAQPASAATTQSVTGRPGAVSLYGPMITGRDQIVYNGYPGYGSYYTRIFDIAGVSVGRSGAYAGTQRIYGAYLLQRYYDGAWRTVQQSTTWYSTVSGTNRLSFPAYTFTGGQQMLGSYGYRIAVVLTWQNTSTGAILGRERVVPSTTADTRCATRMIGCRSYWDGIVM